MKLHARCSTFTQSKELQQIQQHDQDWFVFSSLFQSLGSLRPKAQCFFTSKNCLCSLVHNENSSTFIKSAEIFEAKQKWGQINSMCEYERDCCLFSQTLADTNTVSTYRKKQTHPTPQSNKTKPIQHSSCDTFTAITSQNLLFLFYWPTS